MSEIIDKFYTPLLTGHGFYPDPDNQQYALWGYVGNFLPKLEKALTGLMGRKTFMTSRYTIFRFTRILVLEFSLPECLSITRYDSISGKNYLIPQIICWLYQNLYWRLHTL